MNARRILFAACAGLALGGCTLGPDYARPDLELPAQYRDRTGADAASLASLPWFDLFGSAELTALLREAVAQNLDLRTALARIDEARARAALARSAYGPNVSAQLGTSPSPGSGSHDSTYTLGLALAWEIDLFGKLRRGSEAARAEVLGSEDGARAVMSTLVTQVAGAWFSLRELDAQERIVRGTIASQEESLALVRLMITNGVASGAEEQQALAQLATTRAQLPRVRQQMLATENTLALLLGRYPQALRRDGGDAPGFPAGPEIPAGLPSELLERRPDVRLAEQRLHAATARIGVAIANRFPVPTLGLTGLFGRVSTDLGDWSASGTVDVASWGPTIGLPIVDFGRGKANVDTARAQAEQAVIAYRSAVLQALREVSDSLGAYAHANEVIAAGEQSVAAAREALRLQRLRYRAGVVDYLSVLDAERQLFSADLALSSARLERATSYLDIYRALGGGWADDALRGGGDAAASR